MPKNVLITGAARRIGAACARLLHGEGCNVILHYNSSEADAAHLATELNAVREDSVKLLKADLSLLADVQRLAEEALAQWDGVDVLVNNASLFHSVSMGQVTEQDWDSAMGSNLKAPFFLSQALWSALQNKQGCIVNIADIHAETGLPGYPVYSMAKAGLVAMTKILAREMAPDVRVNAVAPGAILWPEQEVTEAERLEILKKVALQRCGQADDIAKAVRFLVGNADYITGQVLTVDGGRTLFR
ncbi:MULTISPECIES: pteridine reductase [Methylomonas]|uniref:Pteridine reductase n=2 Tax=Methylomonas TaxID=416 RepID=A0A126T5L9_9GAMM|nr:MULTISPECIES: pteridine reductase [Methylomonas]AMK77379.1 pteridine reductase [Methylomonas denitrificans]OAI04975.1 pteridine reductase [Methylomonas methanica]TCV84582.1 pteridine reductase [Methylomonas methanica]